MFAVKTGLAVTAASFVLAADIRWIEARDNVDSVVLSGPKPKKHAHPEPPLDGFTDRARRYGPLVIHCMDHVDSTSTTTSGRALYKDASVAKEMIKRFLNKECGDIDCPSLLKDASGTGRAWVAIKHPTSAPKGGSGVDRDPVRVVVIFPGTRFADDIDLVKMMRSRDATKESCLEQEPYGIPGNASAWLLHENKPVARGLIGIVEDARSLHPGRPVHVDLFGFSTGAAFAVLNSITMLQSSVDSVSVITEGCPAVFSKDVRGVLTEKFGGRLNVMHMVHPQDPWPFLFRGSGRLGFHAPPVLVGETPETAKLHWWLSKIATHGVDVFPTARPPTRLDFMWGMFPGKRRLMYGLAFCDFIWDPKLVAGPVPE